MAVGLVTCFLFAAFLQCVSVMAKQTYIVHMNHRMKPSSYATHSEWYSASLQSLSSSVTDPHLLYTYETVYHGFAASLSPDQVEALRQSDSVLGIYEETIYSLHTTRTPEFLGLDAFDKTPRGERINQASQDMIIGILDTGVWPESKSFDDNGMSPVPKKWRGVCQTSLDFNSSSCNNKLIGARAFFKGYLAAARGQTTEKLTPRDVEGHGTHTSSTAGGSTVSNVGFNGYARGLARGMAPNVRVAAYKVCWAQGCFSSDILAAMERAIMDGVDVLSLSLGGGLQPYYRDSVAIGAFVAVQMGIFVACSAGNAGPQKASLSNVAPWIMTVGAGTLDRDFPAYVTLGNRKMLKGASIYSGKGMGLKMATIVYGNPHNDTAYLCLPGSLNPESTSGKVVVCDRGQNPRIEKGEVVRDAGGVGMILANTAESGGEELVADPHFLPAVAVGEKYGDEIRKYAKMSNQATALLSFGGTELDVRPAPTVAAFSSRGPNSLNPQILKPDVIAPGVNILAAWSMAIGPSGLKGDTRKTEFNIISGTSMSCPHVAGLAALLRAAHPKWSPSAIKSALMTTACTVDNTQAPLRDAANGSISTPLVHGSGHVDIQKAFSPGLVYDLRPSDYITFVCSLGYSISQVKAIVRRSDVTCSKKYTDLGQLNYPSFSIVFGKKRFFRHTRELTNVGIPKSTYHISVNGPSTVSVTVTPTTLEFTEAGEKLKYRVTFASEKGQNLTGSYAFGSIVLSNAIYKVTSPIAYTWTE